MLDHQFKYSGERTSLGELKNSCLRCGRTKEWHAAREKKKKIGIYFNGKVHWFESVEDAKKHLFYI